MNPYKTFWDLLPFALIAAQVDHREMVSAIKRLRSIEDGGQTGYLGGVDPYQAVEDYIAVVCDGGPEPYWLRSAEGK